MPKHIIDVDRWKLVAVPQPQDKPWCYAAVLTSISRFLVDTKIEMKDFVECAFGNPASVQRPGWDEYMSLAATLVNEGIAYTRPNAGSRRLRYAIDVKHYKVQADQQLVVNPEIHGFIVGELRAGRPLICTILGGEHDVVIIGAEATETPLITRLHYWNPSDNGIGTLSLDNFNELNPLCVLSVNLNPRLEMINFVKAKRMYRITTRENLRDLASDRRASLNRSPQGIKVGLQGRAGAVQATHWAWESAQVIRIESTEDLVGMYQQRQPFNFVVTFPNPAFTLEATAVVAV